MSTDRTDPTPSAHDAKAAHDADLQRTAEATSERVQPDDPMTEPPNSTVDDWFGQRVQRDAERLGVAEEGAADDHADAPGAHVDDTASDAVPEPNEPA